MLGREDVHHWEGDGASTGTGGRHASESAPACHPRLYDLAQELHTGLRRWSSEARIPSTGLDRRGPGAGASAAGSLSPSGLTHAPEWDTMAVSY